jgi:gamma-glutamyltranspeptidase/glutathione hydrolase
MAPSGQALDGIWGGSGRPVVALAALIAHRAGDVQRLLTWRGGPHGGLPGALIGAQRTNIRLPVRTNEFKARALGKDDVRGHGTIPAARGEGLAKLSSSVSASRLAARGPLWERAGVAAATCGSIDNSRQLEATANRERTSKRMTSILTTRAASVLLVLGLSTSACSTLGGIGDSLFTSSKPAAGTPGHVAGFLGGVVADEPTAALAGRDVLSAGGNAADAAVAMGLTMAVTLPSRAGLGGGGACLAYNAIAGSTPQAVMFVPGAPANPAGADRPAAVPMMARGMFLLNARFGRLSFQSLISPAEQLARFGVPVSRAFARDLAVVAGPLGADPAAAAVFFKDGRPLAEGERMIQPALSGTLSQLRTAGVGDLYQGALGRRLVAAMPQAGGGLAMDDLRAGVPTLAAPLTVDLGGGDTASFLPPPADGGLAAAAAFKVLHANPTAVDQANAVGLGIAAEWRRGGGDPQALLAQANVPAGTLPALPASTSFAALDRDGNAVICATSMNNLFGTGRIAQGTGILLAASPRSMPAPLLAAGMVTNHNINAFRAMAAGTGQAGAPVAAALALAETLSTKQVMPVQVPEPGRANIITCGGYLPGPSGRCGWASDPRDAGLATGSTEK